MDAEKIFCGESIAFLFVLWVQFCFSLGVSGFVYFRFVVRFCIVYGAVYPTQCEQYRLLVLILIV